MKIRLECVVFYQDNFFTDIELPDDIKFYEYCRHNEKQRFYATICPKDIDLYNQINKEMCGRSRHYDFGDYMILELRQCHPVNEDLPLMSLDDLNKLFDEHINGYYIKSERPSRTKSIKKNKDNKIEILKDGKPIEMGLDWLYDTYMVLNPAYYLEYIAKPLGFVDRIGEDLCMKFAVIRMYSWFDDSFHNHVHRFEIDIKELKLFDEDWSHGQKITISNGIEIQDEYETAIDSLLKMDNYKHIDYRKDETFSE